MKYILTMTYFNFQFIVVGLPIQRTVWESLSQKEENGSDVQEIKFSHLVC